MCKIKNIIAMEDYKLLVEFDNGEEKTFNMKTLIESEEIHKPLKDISLL